MVGLNHPYLFFTDHIYRCRGVSDSLLDRGRDGRHRRNRRFVATANCRSRSKTHRQLAR